MRAAPARASSGSGGVLPRAGGTGGADRNGSQRALAMVRAHAGEVGPRVVGNSKTKSAGEEERQSQPQPHSRADVCLDNVDFVIQGTRFTKEKTESSTFRTRGP
jgi:hypothetical protein